MNRRRTPAGAVGWEQYMPKPGNGGVPTAVEVDAFVGAARANRELRVKVLSELRDRKDGTAATLFTIVTAVYASAAVAFTDQFPLWPPFSVMVVALFGLVTIGAVRRKRHAATWYEAYTEGEAAAGAEAERRGVRRRGTWRSRCRRR